MKLFSPIKIHAMVLVCCLLSTVATAQEIKVTGGFLQDSLHIGEPVGYYLSVKYPQALNVLFPDSTFAFAPFEYNRKQITLTHTVNGISRDSVVYYLSSFEVDKAQLLSLPVFVTSARDCTAYNPMVDTIYLVELVKGTPPDTMKTENLPMKANTLYEKVFTDFNYIILMIVVGVLLVAAIVVWIVFGKRILKHFKLKKLEKAHQKFIEAFTSHFSQLNTLFSKEKAESTVSLWKKYLEQLEQKPYTKLTTRETIQMERDEKLGISLKTIDRSIYGSQASVHESWEELKKFAIERFQKKVEEIKHG
jgi:hypothetical protein